MADIHKPLSILAHIVVFAGIVYTVAHTVLFFVFGTDQDAPLPVDGMARPAAALQDDVPIERIAALHLFGRPSVGDQRPVEPEETLRETRLSLELAGVFVADQADASMAVIARRGSRPDRFAIGDKVLGNAILTAVYADRVVISRGGVREYLRFDDSSSFVQPVALAEGDVERRFDEADLSTELPQVESDAPASSAREALVRYRDEIERDPRALLERLEVDLATDAEGGYTLGALADRPELSHTGLQRGDRILSVNGKSVGDLQEDRLEIDNILALGSASFEVQRGERRFVVTVALN